MSVDWKNNYVIKSFKSRPVLFVLTFVLASFITYEITSTYSRKTYEKTYQKTIENQKEQITSLQTKIQTLTSEISKKNVVIEEEFSEETGKLLKRKKKSETEKNRKNEVKNETKREKIIKEKDIIKEKIVEKKEVVKNIQKNHLYIGYGLDENSSRKNSIGYIRTIGIFDVGVEIQSNERFEDKTILGIFGISF